MPFRTGKDPVQLSAALATIYTVPSDRVPVLIEIDLLNQDSVPRTPEIQIIPSGGSGATKRRIWGSGSSSALAAGELKSFRMRQHLEVGDFIQWKADSANKITAWMSITEEALDATTWIHVDGDFLDSSLATWYTVNSAKQMTLLEVILHNTGAVSRTPTLHLVPGAGVAGDDNMLIGGPVGQQSAMLPGETRQFLFNLHRGAGTTIQVKANVASEVTMKLSLIEEGI